MGCLFFHLQKDVQDQLEKSKSNRKPYHYGCLLTSQGIDRSG